MPLHYSKDGYTFRADAGSLTIEPGPGSITLNRSELEQMGLAIRDDYQVPLKVAPEQRSPIGDILATLSEALRRFEGQANQWKRRDLRRAMVLVGGLDEKTAQEILDQEGM
jgi:hypothetical protein